MCSADLSHRVRELELRLAIAERKLACAEAALAQARQEAEEREATQFRRFREAIEFIPASLMLFDADDRLVVCNSASQHFFPGAKHHLIAGTTFEELLRADIASGNLWNVDMPVDDWVKSTGLGMSLVKSMIKLHGGSIDIASGLGAGTTATLRFPRERTVLRAPPIAALVTAKPAEPLLYDVLVTPPWG